MKTYAEVEQGRRAKGYVYYDYKAINPSAPDVWSIHDNNCKYFGAFLWEDKNGKVIFGGADAFEDTKKLYNPWSGAETAWGKINEVLENFPGATYRDLQQFESLLLIGEDRYRALNCALMSGAKLNEDLLVSDIRACENTSQISGIYKRLAEQVHAAAINGVFSLMFIWGNTVGKDATEFNETDKKVEEEITNMYEKYVLGVKCKKPILFPDFANSFSLPMQVYNYLFKYKEERGRKQGKVLKMLKELENIIEKYVKG